jgi:hypothetical protein
MAREDLRTLYYTGESMMSNKEKKTLDEGVTYAMRNHIMTISFAVSDCRALKSIRLEWGEDIDIHEFMRQVLIPAIISIGYAKQSIYDMCHGYTEEEDLDEEEK